MTNQTEQGAAPVAYCDAYLCKAWGETDMPVVEIVRDGAGVRRFVVREWLGDDNAPDLPKIMEEIDADLVRERAWLAEFEAGGISVELMTTVEAAVSTPEGCTQGHPAHHSSEHTLSLPTQEDIDLAALVHLGYGPGELDAEMRRLRAARRAAHAVEGTANPQAQRAPLSPDELADKCEAWLQAGGASNVVDAYEAGYRACEGGA